MASRYDLEQQITAALHRTTPSAAAPARAGRVAPEKDRAAAIQRQIAAQRARATGAFPANVASARSLADQTFSRREQLKRLKDQLRDLQPQLREALSLKLSKESKRKLAIESISEATATSERLRSSIADARVKRDMIAAIVPEELQAVESLEAENNEDAERYNNIQKILLWFHKSLGFQVIVEEGGVRFVFDKIDPQHPDKEYSFRISQGLKFIDCGPHIKEIEELANDLDLKEHLFKFVKMARDKFQSSFMNDVGPIVSAALLPSPMVNSVNSQSRSKNDVQLLPTKRGAAALSGASPGVLRRSPRTKGNSVS